MEKDAPKRNNIIRCGVLVLALCLIAAGVTRGEAVVIFAKAVKICLECIGLG